MISNKFKNVIDRGRSTVMRAGSNAFRVFGSATAGRRPLPDFLLIGTKRGGTTSLYYDLLKVPQIIPCFLLPDTYLRRITPRACISLIQTITAELNGIAHTCLPWGLEGARKGVSADV